MSFFQFSDNQYAKTVDTGETLNVGSFSEAQNGELSNIRVLMAIKNTNSLGGNEQIRLKVYSDNTFSSLLYTSDWSSISDIDSIESGKSWIGFVRTDFNRENLNKNLTYYVRAEFQNYTRDADNFWLSLCYDFPFPVYDNGENFFYNHPLAMQIFTYRAR